MELTRTSILMYEKCKAVPTLSGLINLCRVLDTTPNYLLGFNNLESDIKIQQLETALLEAYEIVEEAHQYSDMWVSDEIVQSISKLVNEIKERG